MPRVVLGWSGRALIAAEERASVLVVAPPQSGKTTGLAIPAILEWPGPVLATSVKTDLLRESLARRERLGNVDVFDPARATGEISASWTPLGSCGSWHGAQRMAGWLCESARASNLDESDFWYSAAAKLLAPLLYAASTSGADMETVVRWVDRQEEDEVERALMRADDPHALDAARATAMREDRQRSSIYTTAETILAAYADPRVMDAARHPEISPAALLDGGAHTLYLAGPAHEQRRLAPLFAALVEEVVAVAYELHNATGKRLDPPLLIVGDELANIAPIRSLPQIASTGAGQGIQLLSIFQDLAQLEHRWGRSWRTVASAHRAKLFGAGIGDPGTLAYIRELSGESEYEQRSDTSGFLGQHSQTIGATYRSIAPSHVVREADPDSAVLVYGNLPPARLRLRRWYADRHLSALAAVDPGGRIEPGSFSPERKGIRERRFRLLASRRRRERRGSRSRATDGRGRIRRHPTSSITPRLRLPGAMIVGMPRLSARLAVLGGCPARCGCARHCSSPAKAARKKAISARRRRSRSRGSHRRTNRAPGRGSHGVAYRR